MIHFNEGGPLVTKTAQQLLADRSKRKAEIRSKVRGRHYMMVAPVLALAVMWLVWVASSV